MESRVGLAGRSGGPKCRVRGLQSSTGVLFWVTSIGRGGIWLGAAQEAAEGTLSPGHLFTGATFPSLPPVICKQQAPELEPAAALPPLPQPPLAPAAPIPPAQGAPSMDELIQQSQWNLQQQEQHLLALRQVWHLLLLLSLLPHLPYASLHVSTEGRAATTWDVCSSTPDGRHRLLLVW